MSRLEISNIQENPVITINLDGRLDTTTAPELQTYYEELDLNDFENVKIDFEKLEYISSAGLRVLLIFQKDCSKKKKDLYMINVSEDVQEIFDVTGFSDILNIV